MKMTEAEIQARKDKANSYKLMMESWAWQDFYKVLSAVELQAVNDWVSGSAAPDFQRGIVSCVRKIKHEIESISTP